MMGTEDGERECRKRRRGSERVEGLLDRADERRGREAWNERRRGKINEEERQNRKERQGKRNGEREGG